MEMNETDRKLLRKLHNMKGAVDDEYWSQQVEFLMAMDKKFEIQGFMNKDSDFLTGVYLPQKISMLMNGNEFI